MPLSWGGVHWLESVDSNAKNLVHPLIWMHKAWQVMWVVGAKVEYYSGREGILLVWQDSLFGGYNITIVLYFCMFSWNWMNWFCPYSTQGSLSLAICQSAFIKHCTNNMSTTLYRNSQTCFTFLKRVIYYSAATPVLKNTFKEQLEAILVQCQNPFVRLYS